MKAKLFVHRSFPIDQVDEKIFGGFVEHIGRCVYTGVYEPGHPQADKDGFRKDVLKLVNELGMPITRYPGGNFVSGFNWLDSVGPKPQRPVRLDYAWQAKESNQFGLDEFMRWCQKAHTEPMYTVNLGTNTPKAAQELVEYCNGTVKSAWSDLRRRHGREKPYGIKYWCLGNEMDGEWQIGHKTKEEYGKTATCAAQLMKLADPSIKLCVCGSSNRTMATYADWEYAVLVEAYKYIDFLSIHAYFGNPDHDIPNFMGCIELLERQLDDAIALCDAAAARRHAGRPLMVALDEWNVWYRGRTDAAPETAWQEARPINEETYDMSDVLIIGGILQALMNRAARVKIANLAQTVNIIAPIMTEPGGRAWRQTIFHPFALMSRHGRGTALQVRQESPAYDGTGEYKGAIPYLKSAVVHNEQEKEVVVFALNRSLDKALELSAEFGGFEPTAVVEATEIHDDDPDAVNTADRERVKPAAIAARRYSLKGNTLTAQLRPFSWNMFRVRVK